MWPNLTNPPVKLALFQLKFNKTDMKLFDEIDQRLKNNFPIRKDNIEVGINLNNSQIPLGRSKLDGVSDARLKSYIYLTTDQKERVELLEDTATYVSELPYSGWDAFVSRVDGMLSILTTVLGNVEVVRTSIRFVNRFLLDEFEDPAAYFTTVISKAGDSLFPISQYGFRLQYDVPNTNIYAIVNQSVENDATKKFMYLLDIDVLDRQTLLFEKESILFNLKQLREIKNRIFFDSITKKTQESCN